MKYNLITKNTVVAMESAEVYFCLTKEIESKFNDFGFNIFTEQQGEICPIYYFSLSNDNYNFLLSNNYEDEGNSSKNIILLDDANNFIKSININFVLNKNFVTEINLEETSIDKDKIDINEYGIKKEKENIIKQLEELEIKLQLIKEIKESL